MDIGEFIVYNLMKCRIFSYYFSLNIAVDAIKQILLLTESFI